MKGFVLKVKIRGKKETLEERKWKMKMGEKLAVRIVFSIS